MIDLGDELAGFGEELPRPAAAEVPAAPAYYDRGPNGMRTFGKLADLQKGGFNTTPPYPGFDTDDEPMTLTFLLHPPNPFLPVIANSVCPHGTLRHACRPCSSGPDPVVDALRQDEEIATIAVPDQPFKWTGRVVAPRPPKDS